MEKNFWVLHLASSIVITAVTIHSSNDTLPVYSAVRTGLTGTSQRSIGETTD
jgi:hypothetical protein